MIYQIGDVVNININGNMPIGKISSVRKSGTRIVYDICLLADGLTLTGVQHNLLSRHGSVLPDDFNTVYEG